VLACPGRGAEHGHWYEQPRWRRAQAGQVLMVATMLADAGPSTADAVSAPDVVVVVDDDYVMRLSCRQILSKMGFRVEAFEDGSGGLEAIARLKPALVVADLKMPGIGGLELIARVHEIDPEIIILVITGYATIDTAVEAMKQGAYEFLPKPFSPDELRLAVTRGLERRHLLRESRRHEQERELLRRRFVTFVSHQLQTPLVAIHHYLDVLRRLGGTPEAEARRAEWMERCLRRTEEMQALIRDWLALAEVESGAMLRKRAPMDLNPVVSEVLSGAVDRAGSAEIRLVEVLAPDGCVVHGDPTALTMLVDNLVENAIKYNRPGGSVTVTTAVRAGEVLVSVADTGIGIREQDRPFIFDEFFRASDGRVPGTGLGLPICRRIVSELGGTIVLETEEDAGSTFTVRLPVGAVQVTGNATEEN
jgi:two-component system, sensor histidine kinase and response regulator